MSENREVVFFTIVLGKGGAEMHLLRLLNHLNRDRLKPSLCLTRAGGSYEQALEGDVPVHHLPTKNIDSVLLRLVRAVRPLRRFIQRKRPAVVCSVMDTAGLVAARAIAPMERPPTFVMSAQAPPKTKREHAWKHGTWRERIFAEATRHLAPFAYRRADRVVALSKGTAQEVAAMAPSVKARTRVIHNAGFDETGLHRMEEGVEDLPQDGPLVVACGRLAEVKGFSNLLSAFAQVRQHTAAHLWILGEGKQRAALEAQIRRFGLAGCVRLLGFRGNPFKYMKAADLFVLSSLYEGFGNVLVEAMACGTPVVSTDCPHGPGEIIEPGQSGLLVPSEDTEALAEAIVRVLKDAGLRRRLKKGARERAQDFHAEAVTKAYEDLLLDL